MLTVQLFDIEKDGLPKDNDDLTGRLAFIFDGCIVSGWPLKGSEVNKGEYTDDMWEANTDVGVNGVFKGVKKYIIFPRPIWEL